MDEQGFVILYSGRASVSLSLCRQISPSHPGSLLPLQQQQVELLLPLDLPQQQHQQQQQTVPVPWPSCRGYRTPTHRRLRDLQQRHRHHKGTWDLMQQLLLLLQHAVL